MKKIFFFALASLALASCSQDEEFVAEKTNGSNRVGNGALSFSTYTASATRANVVDAAAIKASGFQIAAVYDNALYFNAGETAKVSTDVDNLNHELYDTQQDTYYWPSFSAGAMGFRGFNLGVGATWKNEYHDINFTLGTTASSQKDLVIAYDSVSSKPTTHGDGVQPLNFTHALSKVNFSFAGDKDGNKYTINKVEVFNDAYRLREQGAVLNWFDITEVEGYYSLNDKISEILKSFRGKLWFAGLFIDLAKKQMPGKQQKNNKPKEKKAKKKSKKKAPSMDSGTMDMIGSFTVLRFTGLLTMRNIHYSKEELLKMNAKLNKIKRV